MASVAPLWHLNASIPNMSRVCRCVRYVTYIGHSLILMCVIIHSSHYYSYPLHIHYYSYPLLFHYYSYPLLFHYYSYPLLFHYYSYPLLFHDYSYPLLFHYYSYPFLFHYYSYPLLFHYYSYPLLFHYYSITIPLLFHYYSITIPLLFHYYSITIPLLFHYYSTTIPLLFHYYSITIPLLFHYYSITIPLLFLIPAIDPLDIWTIESNRGLWWLASPPRFGASASSSPGIARPVQRSSSQQFLGNPEDIVYMLFRCCLDVAFVSVLSTLSRFSLKHCGMSFFEPISLQLRRSVWHVSGAVIPGGGLWHAPHFEGSWQ